METLCLWITMLLGDRYDFLTTHWPPYNPSSPTLTDPHKQGNDNLQSKKEYSTINHIRVRVCLSIQTLIWCPPISRLTPICIFEIQNLLYIIQVNYWLYFSPLWQFLFLITKRKSTTGHQEGTNPFSKRAQETQKRARLQDKASIVYARQGTYGTIHLLVRIIEKLASWWFQGKRRYKKLIRDNKVRDSFTVAYETMPNYIQNA